MNVIVIILNLFLIELNFILSIYLFIVCVVDRHPLRQWIKLKWWIAVVAMYGVCLFVFCLLINLFCLFFVYCSISS